MTYYTIEQLNVDGPPFAMALLLRCIEDGEPFVTYGAIRAELEYQLGINRIFPTQIGHVAGSLMDQILDVEPGAPLINVLVTRADGIPGKGAGGYLATRYRSQKLKNWDQISRDKKFALVAREREKVFRYKKWDKINDTLFGDTAIGKLRKRPEGENDFDRTRWGGLDENDEHKNLKEWVANNPDKIGLSRVYGKGETEYQLLSGDKVDVMFMRDGGFRAVEVKSIRSSDVDFQRGIYQCVKYREVKRAEIHPYNGDVKTILVTERKLPSELQVRARDLGVKTKCVAVNVSKVKTSDA